MVNIMKKVLIFTYLQRHLKKLIPIIKEFQKSERIQLAVILMTQEEKEIASENNIPYTMLDAYTEKKRTYDFDMAWGLEPLINAIDSIKPHLFIAIEVNYILRNAIRYCKQQGIPNVIIQHGTPNKYSLHAFAPFEGECFLAWGQHTKDFLVSNHVDEKKIFITGGINFDRTLSIAPNKKAMAQALGIDAKKKWVIFTTQGSGTGNMPSPEEIYDGITEAVREFMKYPDYQLIYQVHPGQQIEEVQFIVNEIAENNAVVTKYKDTEEMIAVSEGVITFFSTTAIDALILGKPLLLINFFDDRDFFPFAKMKAAFAAYSKEEIPAQIGNLLNNPGQLSSYVKKAAEYVNYMNDGKALERVLKFCYNKLNL